MGKPYDDEEYRRIRRDLQEQWAPDGTHCLNGGDLERLDEAHAAHKLAALEKKALRTSERIPKQMDVLVKQHGVDNGGLDNIAAFRRFLAEAVMGIYWQGRKTEALKNVNAVRSGLRNGHESFKVGKDDVGLWHDLVLGVAGFCSMVWGDGYNNAYVRELAARQERESSPFRALQLMQLRHFEDPTNLQSAKCLVALEDGAAGVYGALEGGFMRVRAACSAIECGYDLHDKPPFLEGHSIEDLMRRGLEELDGTASLQSRLNCEAYLLRAHAMRGRLEQVLVGALAIRRQCMSEEMGPHLSAMLALNEALALGRVGQDGARAYREALEDRLVELRMLGARNGLNAFWEFDLKHIRELERRVGFGAVPNSAVRNKG